MCITNVPLYYSNWNFLQGLISVVLHSLLTLSEAILPPIFHHTIYNNDDEFVN